MAVEISKDKVPASVLVAVRTDGRKLPFEPVGGEAIGDVIERDLITETQSIGIVSDVGAEFNLVATAKAANPTEVLADHREDIGLQITGTVNAPIASATYADGARLEWNSSNSNFQADATGAHLAVGAYTSGDARAIIDINKIPGPVTP